MVFLCLLFEPFFQHFLQLVKIILLYVGQGSFKSFGWFPDFLIQPFPDFFRNLFRRLYPLEELREGQVELVVIRFCLNQDSPAEIIERGQAGLSQALVQRIHQRQPLIE